MRVAILLLCVLVPACSGALPSSRVGVAVERVTYPAGDTTLKADLIRPRSTTGPFPAVVVIHGDHGPTARVTDAATKLADHGFLAVVVDLYRGEKVAGDLEAHILDRALPEARVLGDLKAAVDYLATRPDVKPGAIGVVGFDSGGGNGLDFARAEPRVKAVVLCYGRLTTDAELLRPMKASVLGIFAEKDVGIDDATRQSFAKAMEKAGKKVAGLHVVPGTEHGFLAPTAKQPSPPDEARDAAWKHILDYLRAELAGE